MSKKTETLENKALFIQRLVAFVLDILIITFVTSLIATPIVDLEKSNKLSNQSTEVMQKYIDREIDTKTYSIEFMNISYKLARNNGILSFITIILEILYFVVFQIYRNGQTLGKMLMKINIITFTFMIFGSKDIYFYSTGIFGLIQYIIIIISVFMVMFRKDGCAIHDKLAHTNVVRI